MLQSTLSAGICYALPCGPGSIRRWWQPCGAAWTPAVKPWPHTCHDAGCATPVSACGAPAGLLVQHPALSPGTSYAALLAPGQCPLPVMPCTTVRCCQHLMPGASCVLRLASVTPVSLWCPAGQPRRLPAAESRHLLCPAAGSAVPVLATVWCDCRAAWKPSSTQGRGPCRPAASCVALASWAAALPGGLDAFQHLPSGTLCVLLLARWPWGHLLLVSGPAWKPFSTQG